MKISVNIFVKTAIYVLQVKLVKGAEPYGGYTERLLKMDISCPLAEKRCETARHDLQEEKIFPESCLTHAPL